jgi:ubiquinone/menaquinone biosynthesis C-methylase UbiE
MPTVKLALRAAALYLRGRRANPIGDYDLASTGYDDFFSSVMGRHGVQALADAPFAPGADVVELACGTGHLTVEVARRLGGSGSIRAVDLSGGMLTVARRRLAAYPGPDITTEQGDMMDFIRARPDASADVVLCGWAVCYTRPPRLMREIARVLRPGGHAVIIETRADALSTLRQALETVLATDPTLMTRLVHVSLPRDADTLAGWFDGAGLRPVVLREGEQALPWHTAERAVEWVERSGAAAGFRDAVDPGRQDEVRRLLRVELRRRLAADEALRHTFVVGIARRPPLLTVAAAQAGAGAHGD